MATNDLPIRIRCFGYARVSTDDQDLSLQIDALIRFGIDADDIFTDKISGAKEDRPGLSKCLNTLQAGDTLVVWRLDRLGRSMRHLVTLIEELREQNIGFKSISDGAIDTTSASGEMIFNIFAALAQFERRLIQERTKAGLAAAYARGRRGGRRKLSPDQPRIALAQKLYEDKVDLAGRYLRDSQGLSFDALSLRPQCEESDTRFLRLRNGGLPSWGSGVQSPFSVRIAEVSHLLDRSGNCHPRNLCWDTFPAAVSFTEAS